MKLAHVSVCTVLWLSVLTAPKIFGAVLVSCDDDNLRTYMAEGGTIRFECDGVIVLRAPLLITNEVTLDATGRSLALEGMGTNRLFDVRSSGALILRGLILRNGNTFGRVSLGEFWIEGLGGAIDNAGTVLAEDCVFANNNAAGYILGVPGAGRGGAIFNSGSFAANRCTFNSNKAWGGNCSGVLALTSVDG
jgi:hypothetical protein